MAAMFCAQPLAPVLALAGMLLISIIRLIAAFLVSAPLKIETWRMDMLLRQARMRKRFTQAQVAGLLAARLGKSGVTNQTLVSRVERGERLPPNKAWLAALCQILEVEPGPVIDEFARIAAREAAYRTRSMLEDDFSEWDGHGTGDG